MGRLKAVLVPPRPADGQADDPVDDRARRISGTRLKSQPSARERTLSQSCEHCFGSDTTRLNEYVEQLLGERALDPADADELGLALRELLLNAIEHGNLALTFEDKSSGLSRGTWKALLAQRARTEPYRSRKVRVSAHWATDRVSFTIADEGQGFDWRGLPDPTDPENLLRDNGRGVLLATASVDSLYFNASGSEVTVVKRLRK